MSGFTCIGGVIYIDDDVVDAGHIPDDIFFQDDIFGDDIFGDDTSDDVIYIDNHGSVYRSEDFEASAPPPPVSPQRRREIQAPKARRPKKSRQGRSVHQSSSSSSSSFTLKGVQCAVCLSDDSENPVALVGCGHIFCSDCCDRLKAQGQLTCPTCRTVARETQKLFG